MSNAEKISPMERGDREMNEQLIALIEANFKEEELAPDWRSKIGKPCYEFIYERPIVKIKGCAKLLCKPCDKIHPITERITTFPRVRSLTACGRRFFPN